MEYRRLRAPRIHGQCLIDPPLSTAASRVAENQTRAQFDVDILGRSSTSLAGIARRDLVAAAQRYTSAYRDVAERNHDDAAPVVMAGHQPTLFHPGVWFKNFVLDHVARNLNATAINLLIDNDVASQAAIRVPTGTVEAPRATFVAYDRPQPGVPFEESQLRDAGLFASFGDRVRDTVRPFIPDPLVTQLWPLTRKAFGRGQQLYQSLAEGRHCIEQEWGLDTFELPLSEICRQPAFRWFMAHILAHATRFRTDHNETLDEYRRVNRVRSKTHPVPQLASQDQWQETPFWIWTCGNPRRRPLYVRPYGRHVALSDLRDVMLHNVPLGLDSRADGAVEFFAEQERQGIKLRPRALMTTMFCRLFLSDLFVHGIGGAKYDQLTDSLIHRFFGRSAPSFLVVTATAQLPIRRDRVTSNDLRELRRRAREFRFHPERHVETTAHTKPLIEEKQKWIRETSLDLRQRHLALARLNDTLIGFLGEKPGQIAERTAQVTAALTRERVFASREYSFCLFPTATLQSFLLDI